MVTGRRKWITALLGIPVLFLFAAVAGFSPSITRACIMHGLMVLALLFEKEYDSATALSFAVLSMLIANPWTVTNVGFQLSVGCMAGIICFSGRIRDWLMAKKRLGRLKGRGKKATHCLTCGEIVQEEEFSLTLEQMNALGSAQNYLSFMAFSRNTSA